VGESSAKLRPGEKLYMMELLQGALICSGNDACYGIGEAVAGCEPLFVHWLNLKAASLGAYSANWLNTNGLPQEGHAVSVRDLAQISRYAMANPCFSSIVSTQYATIGQAGNRRRLKNTNRLLFENNEIIGIKTGTTTAAGRCLVSAMEHQGVSMLCVVFNSPDRFGESLRLLHYGMDNFKPLQLANRGELLALLPINPDGKTASDLTAVVADNDSYYLCKKNQVSDLSLHWQLPSYLLEQPQAETPAGNLFLLNKEGKILAQVGLRYAPLAQNYEK
jgi:D-alanyl-D-alanine carboxypeptidase (penicillin-binding protein 5/6)